MQSCRLFVCITVVAVLGTRLPARAGQPGAPRPPKKTLVSERNLLTATTKAIGTVDTKFVAMTLVVEQVEDAGQFLQGPPVACFGLRKLGDKLSYTYFILLRGVGKERRLECNFDVPSGVGGHNADVKPYLQLGDRKIAIEYKFQADPKTGAVEKESLTVDGKGYDEKGPRVFLIDFSAAKITAQPVKTSLPRDVPDGYDDPEFSTKVARAIAQLEDKSAAVKEFLKPAAKPAAVSIQSQSRNTGMAGEGTYGMSAASLLIVDNRPVACFGVTKAPKEKEKYSYFILLKSAALEPSKLVRFTYPGESSNAGGKLTTTAAPAILIDEVVKWRYRYDFQANQRPYKVLRESLTIDGKEHPTSQGRVFLLDLTAAKPTCQALKIAAPVEAPEFAKDGWTQPVQRAVAQLRAHPEVAAFLKDGSRD